MPDNASKKLHRVIVATDFSEHANAALRRAVHLPLSRGASVELVHVLPAKVPGSFKQGIDEDAWAQLRRAEARARKMAVARGRSDLDLRSELVRGELAEQVGRVCRMDQVDVIVVGKLAPRSTPRGVRAGPVERIFRTGCAPVLVVSEASSRPYQRPVAALDLDHEPREIVQAALRVTGDARHPLTAVIAYDHTYELYLRQINATVPQIESYRAHCRRKVRDRAHELLGDLEDRAHGKLHLVLHPDEPRAAIHDVATKEHADLLVVGTHARTGASRLLLGSVAAEALRDATCDVLVVPGPKPQARVDVSAYARHPRHEEDRGIIVV